MKDFEELKMPCKMLDDIPQEKLDFGNKLLEGSRKYPIAFQALPDEDLDDLEAAVRRHYRRKDLEGLDPAEYLWAIFQKERQRRAQKYKKKIKKVVALFLGLFLSFLFGLFLRAFL